MIQRFLFGLLLFLFASKASFAEPLSMPLLAWINLEVRKAQLVFLGRVESDAGFDARLGCAQVRFQVSEIFQGSPMLPELKVRFVGAHLGGRYRMPVPFKKGDWVLGFARQRANIWEAGPLGYVVETPFEGLQFFTPPQVVLEDVAPAVSWPFVLDSTRLLVDTRKQIYLAYRNRLKVAKTREARDRLLFQIEVEVKDRLGLPVP